MMTLKKFVNGELVDMSPEESSAILAIQNIVNDPTSNSVNAERDRRIRAGFMFGGKLFDFDDESKQRVTGAATLAGFAIGAGAQAGDLHWHGGDTDFAWIANDNSLLTMDAQTCFLFGKVAAAHESQMIFAARAIKNMSPIPIDFTNDEYWA